MVSERAYERTYWLNSISFLFLLENIINNKSRGRGERRMGAVSERPGGGASERVDETLIMVISDYKYRLINGRRRRVSGGVVFQ